MEAVETTKNVLTRKIGPLPAIAWGGIFGGLYVGYRYWKASRDGGSSVGTQEVTPVVQAVGDVGTADDFSDGYGNATGGFGGSIIPGSTTQNTYQEPATQTNLDWGKQATNWLIATGVVPSDAQNAISAYLYGGMPINETQLAALNEALRKLGSPPEGPMPVPEVMPKATTPAATVPTPSTSVPASSPSTAWSKPAWLTSRFVVSENGGAVYQVTSSGLEWVPSEGAFYALGGGGTVNLASGPYTYGGNPGGTPPVAVSDAVLASLPKVGVTP